MEVKTWLDEAGVIHQDYEPTPPPSRLEKIWKQCTQQIGELWDRKAVLLLWVIIVGNILLYYALTHPQTQALLNTPLSDVPFGTVLLGFFILLLLTRR